MKKAAPLKIRMNKDSRTAWNTLLQRGFHIEGAAGRSVREFLMSVFGYDAEFIETTVRTIFLNSKPVDNMDKVHVKDGDRLALASAMPGLVGIVMGRNNPFKSFRSDIDCEADDGGEASDETIRVFAKILSSLAVQTGDSILKKGIEVERGHLADLLDEKAEFVVQGPAPDELPELETINIQVEFV